MKLKDTRALHKILKKSIERAPLCVCECVCGPGVFTAHSGPVRKMRKLSYDHSAAVALAASRAGERCETKRNCAQVSKTVFWRREAVIS